MEVAVNPLRGVHDEAPLQKEGGKRKRKMEQQSAQQAAPTVLTSCHRLTLQNPAPGCWGLAFCLWNEHAGYTSHAKNVASCTFKMKCLHGRSTNAAFSVIWSTNALHQRQHAGIGGALDAMSSIPMPCFALMRTSGLLSFY